MLVGGIFGGSEGGVEKEVGGTVERFLRGIEQMGKIKMQWRIKNGRKRTANHEINTLTFTHKDNSLLLSNHATCATFPNEMLTFYNESATHTALLHYIIYLSFFISECVSFKTVSLCLLSMAVLVAKASRRLKDTFLCVFKLSLL